MDYFKQIDNTLKLLIKETKIEEAVNMIQEQLKTFVPEPYFSSWKQLLSSLSKQLNAKQLNDELNKWYANLHEDALMSNLVKNHQVDFNFLQLYWKKFPFDENQSQFFTYLFNSNQIKQEDKFLLFYLVVNKINHSFIFYNDIINIHENVNQQTAIAYQEYQTKLNKLFNDEIKKDVTIKQWCHQCLDLMIIYYFPIFPSTYLKISDEKLVAMIINYVNNCQANQNDNGIISKIMQHFN